MYNTSTQVKEFWNPWRGKCVSIDREVRRLLSQIFAVQTRHTGIWGKCDIAWVSSWDSFLWTVMTTEIRPKCRYLHLGLQTSLRPEIHQDIGRQAVLFWMIILSEGKVACSVYLLPSRSSCWTSLLAGHMPGLCGWNSEPVQGRSLSLGCFLYVGKVAVSGLG